MTRKGCLIILSGILGVMGACSGGLLLLIAVTTSDSAEDAEQFLNVLNNGKASDAYVLTSSYFQEKQSQDVFVEFVETIGVPLRYELRPWRDRTPEVNGTIRYRGTLKEGYGTDIDFFIDLIKENGTWKVLSMTDVWRKNAGPGMWFKLVPGEPELKRLTNTAIRRLATAIEKNELPTYFKTETSLALRQETSYQQFEKVYQPLSDKKIDFSAVHDSDPWFNENLFDRIWGDAPSPAVFCPIEILDEETGRLLGCKRPEVIPLLYDDILLISGFYPADPLPVPFTITFTYEHPDWKPYRIGLYEPNVSELSPEQCAKWLIRSRRVDFEICATFDDPVTR